MSIEWVEAPPEPKKGHPGPGRVQRFVELLKQRPGHWAVYPYEIATGTQQSVAAKRNRLHPGTEWTARNVGTDDFKLYARWVGENGEHS